MFLSPDTGAHTRGGDRRVWALVGVRLDLEEVASTPA
jgi:hypothetical protein